MSVTLKYNDEADRALGLAGSVIAITVREDSDLLDAVSLDAPAGKGLAMSADFYFPGNPRMSARIAWHRMVKNLEVSTAILLSNVMCRAYVGQGSRLSSATVSQLKAMVHDEGANDCGLDNDEIDALYANVANQMEQIFTHSRVHQMARTLADTLQQRRTLTSAELLDILG